MILKRSAENILDLDLRTLTVFSFSSSFPTPDLFFFSRYHVMAVAEEEKKLDIEFQIFVVVKDLNMFVFLKLRKLVIS